MDPAWWACGGFMQVHSDGCPTMQSARDGRSSGELKYGHVVSSAGSVFAGVVRESLAMKKLNAA
jgi:hypothetical protein